ncbi:metallophosphoesterase family protein [Primorskyibacter flagellatus]|uniref:Calcineurin-like phosphoesterase n=1 Tax=Primorskyibacter flagellatus TaxID=1387277 RepID=A0A1W2EHX8_9RHOB|nr:metallophosphoesterase [Primorskyibacter flagellatus]SMD09062.1 Calcineurin-like phosphoesterase [Primorskyibacter flagellatus]
MIRIAVLSDPHLHDVRFGEPAGVPAFVRSLADSLHSTRVFNESEAAVRAALDAVAAEGIRLCMIVGDLTDDGQPANWQAVSDLLADYTRCHGIRFFATPGNHDQWSMTGKPLAKNMVDADGGVRACAGRDFPHCEGADICPGMRMVGYHDMMACAGELGYHPQRADLHWETPFGTAPDPARRASACDLSYLVEPVEGLWLLSIDANVYLPDGQGGYSDCSKEGWNAVLRHKSYLLDWMRDVAGRAGAANKRLVAFSHYPVVDVFHGCTTELARLPGSRAGARRMPEPEVTRAIAATGLQSHFSGHWHVDSTAQAEQGGLVNVSVPSTVSYPAGWKCLELSAEGASIGDRPLDAVPDFDAWFSRYRAEAARTRHGSSVMDAADYRQFLDRQFRTVVLKRRLSEDWPLGMRTMVENDSLADMVSRLGPVEMGLPDIPAADVFVDWYRLREAGGGAVADVSPERHALYTELMRTYGHRDFAPGSDEAVVVVFLRTLGLLLGGADNKRAALDRLRAVAVPC